ncbi:hypothetical protein [Corynebacterium variabile]|uniref:hypothetical protein n=1 Tax=Corynebacterium variabile TaxID=1727 RepID=UPI003FD3E578
MPLPHVPRRRPLSLTTAPAVGAALLAAVGLTACSSSSSDNGSGTSIPTLAEMVGQTWEKETASGTGRITLDSASINAPCTYGDGFDTDRGEVTAEMNVLQLTLTYDFTDVTDDQLVLSPTALWSDGSDAVIPDDVKYLAACNQTDHSDRTIMISEAGQAGTVRRVYYTTVLPSDVTGLRIHDKVMDLGEVAPRSSTSARQPSPTMATSAAAEPPVAADADAVEPESASTYTPEIGPNGYPLDPDVPGANQPLPGEPGYEEWLSYTQGLSNAELGNMGVDVSTPNDCDDFLGVHEDADRSNCPG